ncbi:MAG: hypothetical protein ACLU0O_06365 [Collinsella sp.]
MNWATSEEYARRAHPDHGELHPLHRRRRVHLPQQGLPQAERYSGNALIQEAIERHDSDRMAEGLKDAGWATTRLRRVLEVDHGAMGLPARFHDGRTEGLDRERNAIVEARSQLGVPYVGEWVSARRSTAAGSRSTADAQAGIA